MTSALQSALIAQAKKLKDVPTDPESARAIELILRGSSMPAPNDPVLRAELAQFFYGAGKSFRMTRVTIGHRSLKTSAGSRDYDEQLDA